MTSLLGLLCFASTPRYYVNALNKGRQWLWMTLKDIAKIAGVSISTVSRVINSPDNSFATEQVRDRIWNIVKETGYIPNQSAKDLKTKSNDQYTAHSKTIACIFGRTKTPADNPFFAQIARAIEQQALNFGFVLSSSYSIFDINDPSVFQRITSLKADGAIILGRFEGNTRSFFENNYKNLVYTGLNSIDAEWDQVICDGYAASITALEHLIHNGHRRIAYVGETENEIRYMAYKDMLRCKNIPFEASLVGSCPLNGAGGYAGAERLLKKAAPAPTAVFCANDITAIGAVRRILESGLRIPQDISVVSIDNIDVAQYVSPMLTTVGIPKDELGKMATRMLVDRINKGHHLPMKLLLPHKLIIRESTGKVPR